MDTVQLLLDAIADTRCSGAACRLVMISGCQGSGKSWLARRIAATAPGIVQLSLDDFYRPRLEREDLAGQIHPLLATRGVPGTHDIKELLNCLSQFLYGSAATVEVPVFDKLADDRATEMRLVSGQADLVILEGWCLGAYPGPPPPLPDDLVNYPDIARWRDYILDQLAGSYADLAAMADLAVFLKAPNLGAIFPWRIEQELETLSRAGRTPPADLAQQIDRFIRPYRWISGWMIDRYRPDLTIALDARRQVEAAIYG